MTIAFDLVKIWTEKKRGRKKTWNWVQSHFNYNNHHNDERARVGEFPLVCTFSTRWAFFGVFFVCCPSIHLFGYYWFFSSVALLWLNSLNYNVQFLLKRTECFSYQLYVVSRGRRGRPIEMTWSRSRMECDFCFSRTHLDRHFGQARRNIEYHHVHMLSDTIWHQETAMIKWNLMQTQQSSNLKKKTGNMVSKWAVWRAVSCLWDRSINYL